MLVYISSQQDGFIIVTGLFKVLTHPYVCHPDIVLMCRWTADPFIFASVVYTSMVSTSSYRGLSCDIKTQAIYLVWTNLVHRQLLQCLPLWQIIEDTNLMFSMLLV